MNHSFGELTLENLMPIYLATNNLERVRIHTTYTIWRFQMTD